MELDPWHEHGLGSPGPDELQANQLVGVTFPSPTNSDTPQSHTGQLGRAASAEGAPASGAETGSAEGAGAARRRAPD